ncbi:hypothetical protein [Embleya sp. NPDC005971]|uniref:hypothetical protein n=1 Tax=unclassified Embleya TaxID=2699296 RepID=UPI0033CAE7EE
MLERAEADLGERVAILAVNAARQRLGSAVESGFAIGSLAHGGFVAAVSDVDVAFVLRDDAHDATSVMAQVKEDVRDRCSGTELEALADRLSLFWDTWECLERNQESGRFPAIDRADLIESGRLLFGTDRRSVCTPPSTLDLVACGATFFVAKFHRRAYIETLLDGERLVDSGRRAVTKAVMFPVRILYTLERGVLSGNRAAARYYTAARHPGAELVAACVDWREQGIESTDRARALIDEHLVDIYDFAAREQARFLDGVGLPASSRQLRDFASALRPTARA